MAPETVTVNVTLLIHFWIPFTHTTIFIIKTGEPWWTAQYNIIIQRL